MKSTPASPSKTLLLVASVLTLTICLPACQDDTVGPFPTDTHYRSVSDSIVMPPILIEPDDTLPIRVKKPGSENPIP